MIGETVAARPHHAYPPGRAARELGLKRSEFDLGVHLGRIRTVPDEGGGGRRVPRAEIDRLLSADGFPGELRDSVRAMGTAQAAAVMEVTPGRFTRLARLGMVAPVTFYPNRYRAVVWLYLADELRQFTDRQEAGPLLTGRLPGRLRDQLTGGVDLRPRNWRARHLGFLLRQADGPWQRAGALAALLDPVQLSEFVQDPGELARLHRLRPEPPAHGAPGSPAAQLSERLMTADAPDEIEWLRADLAQALHEARAHRLAQRPVFRPVPSMPPAATPAPTGPGRRQETAKGPQQRSERRPRCARGLLGRLRRRSPRHARP
ncbi:DUF6397 family protein [Streptomyces sp. YIM S03343]